jgi:GNAT superfamily N-acetyltransferase
MISHFFHMASWVSVASGILDKLAVPCLLLLANLNWAGPRRICLPGVSVCTVIESDAVSFDNGAQAQELSGVSGSASLKDQTLFLTLTNSHAEHEAEVTLGLLGGAVANGGTARGDNLAYAIDVDEDTPARRRLHRLAEKARERGEVTIRGADLAHLEDEIDSIHHLLNTALAHLPDHIGWHREALEALLQPFLDIADPELVLFAEVDGQTVGWFPGLPNLNEPFQHANGLRYPWDYLKLWWHMRSQPECLAVKSVLVSPEYWGTGVSVLLFDELAQRAQAKGYKWVDMSLTSEDNPNTPVLAERMGAKLYKRYRVYRLMV